MHADFVRYIEAETRRERGIVRWYGMDIAAFWSKYTGFTRRATQVFVKRIMQALVDTGHWRWEDEKGSKSRASRKLLGGSATDWSTVVLATLPRDQEQGGTVSDKGGGQR